MTSSCERNLQRIRIGSREIGDGQPPFVIAEVGINHNGDVNLAKQMVLAAKEAGAHCIKFQTHLTGKEMIHTQMTPGAISKEPLWDIITRCELTATEERAVKRLCDEVAIIDRGRLVVQGTLDEIRRERAVSGDASLEDVFLRLTTEEREVTP